MSIFDKMNSMYMSRELYYLVYVVKGMIKHFCPESVSTTASFKNTVKYAFFDEIETTFHLRATKTKEGFIFCLKKHEHICITYRFIL